MDFAAGIRPRSRPPKPALPDSTPRPSASAPGSSQRTQRGSRRPNSSCAPPCKTWARGGPPICSSRPNASSGRAGIGWPKCRRRGRTRWGLGWANHDHHTYRSSREQFARLIGILEELGVQVPRTVLCGARGGLGRPSAGTAGELGRGVCGCRPGARGSDGRFRARAAGRAGDVRNGRLVVPIARGSLPAGGPCTTWSAASILRKHRAQLEQGRLSVSASVYPTCRISNRLSPSPKSGPSILREFRPPWPRA